MKYISNTTQEAATICSQEIERFTERERKLFKAIAVNAPQVRRKHFESSPNIELFYLGDDSTVAVFEKEPTVIDVIVYDSGISEVR